MLSVFLQLQLRDLVLGLCTVWTHGWIRRVGTRTSHLRISMAVRMRPIANYAFMYLNRSATADKRNMKAHNPGRFTGFIITSDGIKH